MNKILYTCKAPLGLPTFLGNTVVQVGDYPSLTAEGQVRQPVLLK
jgi:hypothetical protein